MARKQRPRPPDRPKKKRRLVSEEPLIFGGVPALVWKHKRKWYIGWSDEDDGKVWYQGRARS